MTSAVPAVGDGGDRQAVEGGCGYLNVADGTGPDVFADTSRALLIVTAPLPQE